MTLMAERQLEHIGETKGCADHDHDIVHELSKRLDSLWRCDQYIANAEGYPQLKKFWEDIKTQETDNITRMKEILAEHVSKGCF